MRKTASEGFNRKRGQKASRAIATSRRAEQYGKRNAILRKLGYQTYQSYLDSRLWYQIRSLFLLTEEFCEKCGAPATQVHHGRYTRRNLDGSSFNGLHALCAYCHLSCEFASDGFKLSPTDATRRLRRPPE